MPDVDPTTAPYLVEGSELHDWVSFLQSLLVDLGHLDTAPDGMYGEATAAAVTSFQQVAGLLADGIVGPQTWAALAGMTSGVATGRFDPATAPWLDRGTAGDWVSYLQRLLVDAGHDPGPIDALFGPLTEAAVREFQQAQGLAADGIVGPRTWEALDPFAEAHSTDPPIGSAVTTYDDGGGDGGDPSSAGTPGATGTGEPALRLECTIGRSGDQMEGAGHATNVGPTAIDDVTIQLWLNCDDGREESTLSTPTRLEPNEMVSTWLALSMSFEADRTYRCVGNAWGRDVLTVYDVAEDRPPSDDP